MFAHSSSSIVFFFPPSPPLSSQQITEMGSAVRLSMLGLFLCLQLGRAPARSPRTADQVSEADIQRLLHGVMEQLGIARPRVEYPAHQATNIVGPQSIQGMLGGFKVFDMLVRRRKMYFSPKKKNNVRRSLFTYNLIKHSCLMPPCAEVMSLILLFCHITQGQAPVLRSL